MHIDISHRYSDHPPRKARLPPTSIILHSCPTSHAKEPPVLENRNKKLIMWVLSVRQAVSYAPLMPVSTFSGCSSTPNVCIRALRISARGALWWCQCGHVVRRSDRESERSSLTCGWFISWCRNPIHRIKEAVDIKKEKKVKSEKMNAITTDDNKKKENI